MEGTLWGHGCSHNSGASGSLKKKSSPGDLLEALALHPKCAKDEEEVTPALGAFMKEDEEDAI